jgi:hypothetical protein
MSSPRCPLRKPRTLVRLACLAAILASTVLGCSGGSAAPVSPEAQAQAKENFKKRFGDYGAKPGRKSVR